MGGSADPHNPDQFRTALGTAVQQPESNVGQVCATCPDNWVEVGAIDETGGEPLPGLGYRVYDIATGDRVVSGTLDAEGKSPRHNLPMPITQLYAVFGTEEAMDEAESKIADIRREQALQDNAVSEWRGIPAGLTRDAFDQQIWERARNGDAIFADKGFLGGAGRGGKGIARLPGAIGEAIFGDGIKAAAERYYEPYIDEAWDQYQLATGARAATGGESFMAAMPQGATLGFDEEIGARLSSLFDKRSYEELVEGQRQILRQQQISNPGAFMGGEIVGSIPTVFIPVGGAAANAARAGRGAVGAARSGAVTGAGFGAVSGAGHDEGGFVDRLDGAAIGAATGGIGGAIVSGAGVLIARGVSRTRIWAKIAGRVPPKRQPWENPSLGDEWYDPKTGELLWPNTQTTGYPDGFSAMPVKETLPVGTRIDRYSAKVGEMDTGNFLSPAGTSFESRALPWNQATQNYSVYEVIRPLPVDSGTAIPWFGSTGGATQYKTGISVGDLIRGGYIAPIN